MKKKLITIFLLILTYKLGMKYAYASDIRATIRQVKAQYPFLSYIPENLVLAIARAESSLNPSAIGKAGEYGLMQIHPVTWKWVFNHYKLGEPDQPFDPFTNILAGMLVLDAYYKMTGSWIATVQAYNIGVGAYRSGLRNWAYLERVLTYWAIS